MRLVSWNLNSLKARSPRVFELLDAHAPDVLLVQETKCGPDAFPHDALAQAGYRAVDHGEGRWNGVAVLAPEGAEVEDVQRGLPGEPNPDEARWIEATVDGVRVVSVYVVNGRDPADPMFTQKLDFLDAARDRAAELLAAGPTVIAGDWNVTHEDRDVWDRAAFDGATHVTPDERARLQAVLDLGYVDAYRDVAPGSEAGDDGPDRDGFTWWDYRMGAFRRGMGLRIDLALVSPHLAVRSVAIDTVFRRNNAAGDKPSDHAPLVVELDHRA